MWVKRELKTQYERLARELIAYVQSQVRLWQKVPYWALQADGRPSWDKVDERLEIAYKCGLWQPGFFLQGKDRQLPSIDCASGEFVLVGSDHKILMVVTNPDPDTLVPLLDKSARHLVDAREVLAMLRKQSRVTNKQPGGEKYRETLREQWKVTKVYRRS